MDGASCYGEHGEHGEDGRCISESPILSRLRVCDKGFVNLFDGMVTAEDTARKYG